MSDNPFTVREIGEPGALKAIADFVCPKCLRPTRFTPYDELPEGGFECPHCQLLIQIEGARLSDFQAQLDAINASLGGFVDKIQDKMQTVAEDIGERSGAYEGLDEEMELSSPGEEN